MSDPLRIPPPLTVLHRKYDEIILASGAALDGFGHVVAHGAYEMVSIAQPNLRPGSTEHERYCDLVVRGVVFHMGVDFATHETTMNIADYLARKHGARACGNTYLYESLDPLIRR